MQIEFAPSVLILVACLIAATARAATLPPEIENPECLGINREPHHATLMPYPTQKEALAAKRAASSFARSLNGPWKFHWVKSPELRPEDFYKPEFDVSGWKEIPVPSNWQVLGYGTPYYRNAGYIFKKDFPHVMSEPPKDWTAYDERNPVGSYRRDFEVPADWDGQRIFLTFDGVDSAFFLWINGRKVGYSVNSRNAAEFDVTSFVKPGHNMVAVEVYRFSAGSFLEDQDMWRLSGIFRGVTLWRAPTVHIRDFFVRTEFDAQFKDASILLKACVKNYSDKPAEARKLRISIMDLSCIADVPAIKAGDETSVLVRIPVSNPPKWTAETPNLETLVLSIPGEFVSARIGFRKVEIKGRTFTVNGTPVKLKGVNRHEMWPDTGHAVTEEQMIRDLEVLKQGNCNHVRTSHYSNDPRWYELCDEWGIWLVAEANCECHGYDHRFDEEPRMHNAIVDRTVANVVNFRNHPSVIIWSLGNECGGRGKNFCDALDAAHRMDASRPVHYERFGIGEGNPSDFDGKMYGTPADFAKVASNPSLTKPFYICEFAHAMFNSMGSLSEYSEVFDRFPSIAGAAIWEWQDQALWNRRDPKHPILAYGGGFGEVPNDHYFIHKGVVAADRSPKPHYPEMKRAYQWIGIEATDLATGNITVRNKYQFTPLAGFNASWSLTEDGQEIAQGALPLPPVAPGAALKVVVPFKLPQTKAGAEYFLRISFALAQDERWAPKGFEVAAAQFQLPGGAAPADAISAKPVTLQESDAGIAVSGDGFKVVVDRRTGTLSELSRGGVNLLAADGGPRLHLWRAPHRNDDMWAYRDWETRGITGLKFAATGLKATQVNATTVRIEAQLKGEGRDGFAANHAATYTITGDGAIAVDNDVKFDGPQTVLARIGVRMLLDKRLDTMDFLGRGPMENYADRKSGFDVGLYHTAVEAQYAYEKPMERANHEDVRWVALTGSGIPGLLAQADGRLLQMAALPHTDEQMMPVEYKIDLPPSTATVLTLAAKTLGVGSNGCGPKPLEKYIVRSKPTTFSYVLRLLDPGQAATAQLGRQPPPARERPAGATPTVEQRTNHSRWRVVSCTSFQADEGLPNQAIDGNPDTYWHSRWKPDPTANPHELVLDFGESLKVAGVLYWAREDMENGRVKDYSVFFSTDGTEWGQPALTGKFANQTDVQQADLPHPVTARFMKFVARSEVNGNPFASVADLDIVPAAPGS